MRDFEVWILVDETGDYAVGEDANTAAERYADNIGNGAGAMRSVKVTLRIPLPKPIEVTAEIPAESETCNVTVG